MTLSLGVAQDTPHAFPMTSKYTSTTTNKSNEIHLYHHVQVTKLFETQKWLYPIYSIMQLMVPRFLPVGCNALLHGIKASYALVLSVLKSSATGLLECFR